jgi:hypothetical protein
MEGSDVNRNPAAVARMSYLAKPQRAPDSLSPDTVISEER